jgi:uncharacterized protein YyaL (SSP411 family)
VGDKQHFLDHLNSRLWHPSFISDIRPQGNVSSSAVGAHPISTFLFFIYANFMPQDPHGELKNKNVLHLVDAEELAQIAETHKMSVAQVEECIEDAKRFLAEERAKRPKPHLDNKIITSWNALAISGLCAAAQAMPQRPEFRERAERAVNFIREQLLVDGDLLRSAYADDQGNIVQM